MTPTLMSPAVLARPLAAVSRRLRMRSTAARVWSFTLLLAVLAVLGYLTQVHGLPELRSPLRIPWPLLAFACFLAETRVIVVHFRRETHSFSLSEVPAVIGLFFVPPVEYLAAILVGSALALVVTAHQSRVKVAFNLANFALIGVLTLAVFRAVGGFPDVPGPREWVAAFAAMLVGAVVGSLTIATAISLSGGAPQFQKLPEMLRFGGLVALANTSLALLAVSVMWVNPMAGWLLIVPLVTLFLAYRAYVSEREKHERLELLYQSSRILQHSPELDSALVALLDHARNMFRAEVAEVVLYPRSGDEALRTRSFHEGPPEAMVPFQLGDDHPIHARVASDRRAFFAGGGRGPTGDPAVRQAMVSPLAGESGLIGAVIVANRLTEGTTFDDDDLRLLETLANQAAVALENGQLEQSLAELSRLKEELRYQAFHDPLTGLANRVMFAERVDASLATSAGEDVVVLFLDLDDFKVVNDTLGHAAGDRLLAAVAERIKGCVRGRDLAARLGGDEFAILLVEQPDLERALTVGGRIIDALTMPFPIAGTEVVVGGSIGVAAGRGGTPGADELLRNADVAMYTAKAAGKGRLAVFEPTMHAAIVARHALSAELSRSIGQGELAVFYQPIVELSSGRAVGVEALVRWRHPTRGLVPPDEFIHLAEETGTILALGEWVIAEACTQAAAWHRRQQDADFFVSVNLSPRQLQHPDIVETVERALRLAGLSPRRLVVELTETAMFQDTETTIGKLEALRARGVRIALDDFGTGYSSLGYLRRFPVDILKIARDFVVAGDGTDGEWAFAHAIVALGQTLGLQIIAEGIEEFAQSERLRTLGCDLGQGFWFGRPVEPGDLEARLFGSAAAALAGSPGGA
jgi:diguanylate cyclase (GGDEF)-like protein